MEIPFFRYDWFYNENRDEILSLHDKILSSGHYVNGEYTRKLENKLAEICSRKYAVATASCTDALFFALQTAGIKPGDGVIVTPFSFVATLDSILRCGAFPIFVDIDENFMLDGDKLEDAITPQTKAIVFVQLFGNCHPKHKQIREIAEKYGIALIEDNAQGIGARCNGIPSGKFGDFGCISFDPTKLVSAHGTGGAVVTDNKNAYLAIKKLQNHGLVNGISDSQGYNSKISEAEAASVLLQLEKLPQTIERMNAIAQKYFESLKGISHIILPGKTWEICNYHKFVIRAQNRDALRQHLSNYGIETKIHYGQLLSEMPLLKGQKYLKHNLARAEKIKSEVLSLPIFPGLTDREISYICKCIKDFNS